MTYHDALMTQLTTLVNHVRKLRQRLQHVDESSYKVIHDYSTLEKFYDFFDEFSDFVTLV